jgi:ADP-heptose:LPS heptosyltransferase
MILYIKNIISLLNFFFLKIFFGKRKIAENRNILFYNSEKIGDIMLSSIILENDESFPEDVKIYFLIKENYYPLLMNYKGKIKIITYNYKKYKWFLPYRFFLLKKLRELNIDKLYNLTPARGMLNDEISLLSGANKTFAINKDKKYLKGFVGKIMDGYYEDILFSGIKNEYVKNEELLRSFTKNEREINFINKKTFKISGSNNLIDSGLVKKNEYIIIAPLSTDLERTWGVNNFVKLGEELSKSNKIVLVGSPREKSLLEKIKNNNDNIIVDTSSLKDLPDIIFHCRLFIGGDSGLTHIALKLGKPLLAILDGGFFNRYFPYKTEEKKNNYIYHMMDCFECGFDCIYEKKYCLENISFEDVLNKINQLLKI